MKLQRILFYILKVATALHIRQKKWNQREVYFYEGRPLSYKGSGKSGGGGNPCASLLGRGAKDGNSS